MSTSKRKSYHHGDLKAQLTDAALVFLESHEPDALSLRDLSRSLGVSPMAPYRHFEDKAALLLHLAEAGCRLLLESMRIVERAERDPLGRLSRSAEVYVEFALSHPSQFRLIFGPELQRNIERGSTVIQLAGECIGILVQAITEAQSVGSIRADQSPVALANVIWMAVHGYADLKLSGHQETGPDEFHLLIETILRGIGTTGRERSRRK